MSAPGRVRSPEMSYLADFYRDSTAIHSATPRVKKQRLAAERRSRSQKEKHSQQGWLLRLVQELPRANPQQALAKQ